LLGELLQFLRRVSSSVQAIPMFEKGACRPGRLEREINCLLVEASASAVKHGSGVVRVENWQPGWWRLWSAVGERSGLGISLM
jgi:hypothetical protein